MSNVTQESEPSNRRVAYQRARLNISLPHPLRHALDVLAREQNISTTRMVQHILEDAILAEMHASTPSSGASRCV